MSADRFPALRIVNHPLVQTNLTRLRDARTAPEEFRRRLRELTLLMTYELTRDLPLKEIEVQTPMARCSGCQLAKPVVVVPILRAALGMAEAVLEVIPSASVGHIGLFRANDSKLPQNYFSKQPSNLSEARTLLIDPMLATGNSACSALDTLKKAGAREIAFLCLVSCPEGVEHVTKAHSDVPIFTAALDSHLDQNAYIIPGLGDAGDRYFGTL